MHRPTRPAFVLASAVSMLLVLGVAVVLAILDHRLGPVAGSDRRTPRRITAS